jgi:non-lysosomal glucosylceramidase
LEEKLWNGENYLLFSHAETGTKSDTILANQLAGQWCSRLHGLPGAFPETRVSHTLRTVEATCVAATANGALNALRPNGTEDHSAPPHSDGIFTGECLCLAATLIYEGRRSAGIEVACRMMSAIVLKEGAGWELPNILDGDGCILHGQDFYQMMMLWTVPLALDGHDIARACAPQGFVDRILRAAAGN